MLSVQSMWDTASIGIFGVKKHAISFSRAHSSAGIERAAHDAVFEALDTDGGWCFQSFLSITDSAAGNPIAEAAVKRGLKTATIQLMGNPETVKKLGYWHVKFLCDFLGELQARDKEKGRDYISAIPPENFDKLVGVLGDFNGEYGELKLHFTPDFYLARQAADLIEKIIIPNKHLHGAIKSTTYGSWLNVMETYREHEILARLKPALDKAGIATTARPDDSRSKAAAMSATSSDGPVKPGTDAHTVPRIALTR